LGRIGGRPSTPFELTETERKIASPVDSPIRRLRTRCSSAPAPSRQTSSGSIRSSTSDRGRSWRPGSVGSRNADQRQLVIKRTQPGGSSGATRR
jgi:hypothetical protein